MLQNDLVALKNFNSKDIFCIFSGLFREPKWSHLRDLHRALRLSRRALLWGTPTVQTINQDLEVIIKNSLYNIVIDPKQAPL